MATSGGGGFEAAGPRGLVAGPVFLEGARFFGVKEKKTRAQTPMFWGEGKNQRALTPNLVVVLLAFLLESQKKGALF